MSRCNPLACVLLKDVCMSKQIKIGLMIASVVAMTWSSANAVPTLRLTSGATVITVTDGGVGDANAAAGAVTYIGAVGVFTINVTTGISSGPAAVPNMDLNSVDTTSAAGGTLKIEFSDNGFTPVPAGFSLALGGVTQGTASFAAYADSSNALFGTGTLLASSGPFTGAFADTDNASSLGISAPYSLTLVANLTHSGAQNSSFNYHLTVPDGGATLMLLGSSLTVLGLFARSRKIRA